MVMFDINPVRFHKANYNPVFTPLNRVPIGKFNGVKKWNTTLDNILCFRAGYSNRVNFPENKKEV